MASISRVLPTDGRLSQCTSRVPAPATRRVQTQLDSLKLFPFSKNGISLRIHNSRPLSSVFTLESASSRSSRVACNAAADLSGYIGNTCWDLQTIFSYMVGNRRLGFLMLSMGLTLTFEDFRRCLRNPWTVRANEIRCMFNNLSPYCRWVLVFLLNI